MQHLTFSVLVLAAFTFAGCKAEQPKHAEKKEKAETAPAPKTDEKPMTDQSDDATMPTKEEPKKEPDTPVPAVLPTGPTADFPYTIEFPKELMPRSATFNNACDLATPLQTGSRVSVSFKGYGGYIEPGSPAPENVTTSFRATLNNRASCSVWGRIKNVPAGYKIRAAMSDTGMRISANMKAANGTTYPEGDRAFFSTQGLAFGYNPANAETGRWYSNIMVIQRGSYAPTKDISNAADIFLSATDLGGYRHDPDTTTDVCPPSSYDFIFYMSTPQVNLSTYSTTATVPADGFRHSFFLKQWPDITLTLMKCN